MSAPTTIKIKSFNGIGDLLFVTPALRVIREAYPNTRIIVNTNYPQLLFGNPFIDRVIVDPNVKRYRTDDDGVFLGYPDPKHGKIPECHHIISDWRIMCEHYGIETREPDLQPEIHCILPTRGDEILVQKHQKGNWHGKKNWPYFKQFAQAYGFKLIPKYPSVRPIIHELALARAVVCIEGGISHVAKAVHTPAVVIFGGFARPSWSGYEDHENIVNEKPHCSPCYNAQPCCEIEQRWCMTEITPETVFDALDCLLEGDLRI
ncbi:MAG: glycosyltransferase family 9 protein [Patescibacteria group bacterium]